MRNLGDHSWLNDYIGIPYVIGGRGWSGVDCYGLVKLVYENEYGEELPDWSQDVFKLTNRAQQISEVLHSGEWEHLEEPREGCFVVCSRKASYHLGLYFAGGVLHSLENTGCVYQPLELFKAQHKKVTFGEWSPCQ
jgi:cell wall-associated NlpC family hydrolase